MTSSPRALTAGRTYARSTHSGAVICGLRSSTQLYIRDRSHWETFDATDLSSYLADGVEKASAHLERIAYLDHPYTVEDEQNLVFMVDALLQARHVADDSLQRR